MSAKRQRLRLVDVDQIVNQANRNIDIYVKEHQQSIETIAIVMKRLLKELLPVDDVAQLIIQYQEYISPWRVKYPKNSPLWLTQWFSNRNHFHCLMKNQGLKIFQSSVIEKHVNYGPTIYGLFLIKSKAQDLEENFKMRMWQFQCKMKHADFQGVHGYQCDICVKVIPTITPGQTELIQKTNRWILFVDEYLDLMFEYLTKLSPDIQNTLALELDENWLESTRDSVR